MVIEIVQKNTWMLIYGGIYETYAVPCQTVNNSVIQIVKVATKLESSFLGSYALSALGLCLS
jgi:hypothetical protein